MTVPTTLELAWRELAIKAAGIKPARITGEPDAADGAALVDDLLAAARMFDNLFFAYGNYAREHLGLSAKDVDRHFAHPVSSAIEGNATFIVEEAIQQIDEARREYLSDPRGWDRAAMEGVD